MPSPRSITLQDVAVAASVHVSTVSLALTRSPKLARATGERLRALAREMGYRTNPVFHALAARRRGSAPQRPPVILFLTNRPTMEDFQYLPHMPGFLAGARAQAEQMGFACEFRLVGDAADRGPKLTAELEEKNVQGIILGAFLPHWPGVELDWSRFAVVKIDSHYLPPRVPRISYDHAQIVRTACERLHALGYRRIGMAVGQFDEDGSDQTYFSALVLQQHLLGLPRIPPLHFAPLEPATASARRVGEWVRRHRLDAVISNWTSIIALLRRSGIAVPRQVACAGLCLPRPDARQAGLVMNHELVGRKAVENVALLIKTQSTGTGSLNTTLIEGTWHDGASAPCRPGARRSKPARASQSAAPRAGFTHSATAEKTSRDPRGKGV